MNQNDTVSSDGLCQDLRIVGKKPKLSMPTSKIIEVTGCLAKSHIPIATRAVTKQKVSNKVISFTPFLSPRKKMTKDRKKTVNVTYEPGPEPLLICRLKIEAVITPQMNQLYGCGLVLFFRISLI